MIKILIIDDDSNFRVYLSHLIEKEFKADIKYANDGKEGYVITVPFKPDLIIVDDDMPEMRGDKYVEKVRGDVKFKDTPIVVMTASNDNNTISKYIDFKINDYIVKPLNSDEALRKIGNIINMHNKNVLVVDDNRAFGMFVEKVIRSKFHKCTVRLAENGNDALVQMEEEKPSLILLDNAMPGMSGKEFLKNIRSNPKFKNIQVVMVTSQSERELVNQVTELGISDYILKPVTLQDLYSKLIRYLD